MDLSALHKISYGLFVITAKDGKKDNGCISNTVMQVTAEPARLTVAINKSNFTADMIIKSGEFNVSILTQSTPFSIFERFGFASGKDTDKFANCAHDTRTKNGIRYIPKHINAVISAKVKETHDCGTHILFIADITETLVLSDEPSATYQYYFDNIKPKPKTAKVKGYECKICSYVFEGDPLPSDFICPWCKHGADYFKQV